MTSRPCKHTDVREFGGLRSCLACGETRFQEDAADGHATTDGTNEYIYTDLRCLERGTTIRLVLLQPGEYEDPLRCSLVISGLEYSEYEAISYTWATEEGDVEKSQPIYIDGSILYITKNCDAAIRCMRQPAAHVRLWVDAICIHQANTGERNHQVELMSRIYRQANGVHVCIRDPARNYSGCLEWLRDYKDHPEPTDDVITRFATLFRLQYFKRVWVIQEVALAKRVTLRINGQSTILTNDAVSQLHAKIGTTNGINLPAPFSALLRKNRVKGITEQLAISMFSACSDDRDRVYGTLSLLPPHLRLLLPVDYSLQVEDVFSNAIFACILSSRNLHVLHFARLDSTESDSGIAYNFTDNHFRQYLECDTKLNSIPYNSGHPLLNSLNFESDASRSSNSTNIRTSLPEHQVTIPVVSGQLLPCFTINALLIDVIKLPTGTEFESHENYTIINASSTLEVRMELINQRLGRKFGTESIRYRRLLCASQIENFYRDNIGVTFTAFHTQYGYGLSQVRGLPGDRIFRLEGAAPLFILRPSTHCRYRIVSACYWTQTISTDDATWVDIEVDAVINAKTQTQKIEIY